MISVAMTSYNGKNYIEKQLQSIFEQTKKPDEVIIVDDCSTDNTVEIIEDFINRNKLKNWRLVKSTVNNGYKEAFYKAIMHTNGDFIFLCDHDDIWMSDKLKLMSEVMEENPKIMSLSSGFVKIDNKDNCIKSRNSILSSNNNLIRKRIKKGGLCKISLREVVLYNISPGCTSAFRKDLKKTLTELKGPEYDLVHDWKINIIASMMDGLYFLNLPTIKYRLHSGNTIGLSRNYAIDHRIELIEKSFAERKLIQNIISDIDNCKLNQGLLKDVSKTNIYIYNSILERINSLKTCSLFRSCCVLLKYKYFKNRMIESWLMDFYIILINRFKLKKSLR